MADCCLDMEVMMDINYEVIEKTLKADNFTVNFEHNIQDVILWDGIYTILLSIPNEVDEVDNIYGVKDRKSVV